MNKKRTSFKLVSLETPDISLLPTSIGKKALNKYLLNMESRKYHTHTVEFTVTIEVK